MKLTTTRRARTALTIGIALVLMLSACSSSANRDVAATKTTDAEQSGTDGGATDDGGSTPVTDAAGQPVAGSTSNTGPTGAGGATRPGATGSGSRPAGSKPLAMGHGVTADKIQLGISWIDLNAYFAVVNAAFGTNAQNPSSSATTKDWSDVIIKHQNANGGLLGRKIEPIYYEIQTQDLLTPQGRAQAEQQMCATFTQDNKVFAILPLESNEGVVLECAKKADTPMIGTSNTDENLDRERFGEAGAWWFKPNWLSGERREQAMVARLLSHGWFGKDAKVGIMVEDKPQYRRSVDKGLKPALARAGVKVVSEVAWPDQVESPWDNYVLQFRTAGVTHILWTGCGCAATPPGLFMRAAENQGYRAKHALGSEYLMRGIPTIAPHEQLAGMSGIGWGPEFDYGAERAAAEPAISPADGQCRSVMRKAGINIHGGMYCEFIFFLSAALQHAPSLTRAGFTAGVEALGTAYSSVGTPATRLGPGRHDGTSAVWDVIYDDACTCIKYKGKPHPIG